MIFRLGHHGLGALPLRSVKDRSQMQECVCILKVRSIDQMRRVTRCLVPSVPARIWCFNIYMHIHEAIRCIKRRSNEA
jgi:hypothetical protein